MVEIINKYETIFIINPDLDEEKTNAVVEKFKSLIEEAGEIENLDIWGKRKLAYEIQKMREGFYYFVRFEADAACPAEVEKRVRIMENVIRYLCVRQDA